MWMEGAAEADSMSVIGRINNNSTKLYSLLVRDWLGVASHTAVNDQAIKEWLQVISVNFTNTFFNCNFNFACFAQHILCTRAVQCARECTCVWEYVCVQWSMCTRRKLCVCACECVSSINQRAVSFSSQWAAELTEVAVRDSVTFTAQRLMETPCCTWPSVIISERKEPLWRWSGWKVNGQMMFVMKRLTRRSD